MRRGELLAVQWVDVNLVKGTLLVRAVERGAKNPVDPDSCRFRLASRRARDG